MLEVELKPLMTRCGTTCTKMLQDAAGMVVTRSQYEVTLEHFLLACLADAESDIPQLLSLAGIETARLSKALTAAIETFRNGNSGRPVLSPLLTDALQAAWLVSSIDLGFASIRTGAVLLAFLSKPSIYAQGDYIDVFQGLRRDDARRLMAKVIQTSKEASTPFGASAAGGSAPAGTAASTGDSFIKSYCEDFTAKARDGRIDPVFGRDKEIRQMVDILGRRRKNNPILVGEPGVGKTAVLEGLALRITEGDVPETLQGVTLLSLDLGLLEAGAGMKGEFERRLKGVLDEIKASPSPIVLFIDEAHMLVGAGGAAGGSDAANLMKPALARGEIRTCAATTWKEYKKYFEKDPALARRFQLVSLAEPDVPTAALILRGIRPSYEKAHSVLVRDDAVESAAQLAHRYITGRFLPDKAIDLLDTACSRVKVSQSSKPAALEDAQRQAQALSRRIDGMTRDARNGVAIETDVLDGLKAEREGVLSRAAELEASWHKELEAAKTLIDARDAMLASEKDGSCGTEETAAFKEAMAAFKALANEEGENLIHVEVTPETIARVVADWTGIPVGKLAREQAAVAADLQNILGRRIKGQDDALAAMTRVIQASAAGLRPVDQPKGVFLFVGPSGVGKTETGLALADALFGDEESIISVNMSEFQEKHTVSRLIGSPPGYVGYGEGGMLTEAVRRRPYSVVLLDEVEKAHPDVMNLFYQVFDKGVLTDGEGKVVSFRNTVIILTSNLASDIIQELSQDADASLDDIISAIRPVASEHFRPALLARMNIVPFRSLAPEALRGIADLKLKALARRLEDGNRMQLVTTAAVTEQIVARCSEIETGARNIEYILSGTVLPELSRRILEQMGTGSCPERVTIDVAEDGSFRMDFGDRIPGACVVPDAPAGQDPADAPVGAPTPEDTDSAPEA